MGSEGYAIDDALLSAIRELIREHRRKPTQVTGSILRMNPKEPIGDEGGGSSILWFQVQDDPGTFDTTFTGKLWSWADMDVSGDAFLVETLRGGDVTQPPWERSSSEELYLVNCLPWFEHGAVLPMVKTVNANGIVTYRCLIGFNDQGPC